MQPAMHESREDVKLSPDGRRKAAEHDPRD